MIEKYKCGDIPDITKDFIAILGSGSFGTVYKTKSKWGY